MCWSAGEMCCYVAQKGGREGAFDSNSLECCELVMDGALSLGVAWTRIRRPS